MFQDCLTAITDFFNEKLYIIGYVGMCVAGVMVGSIQFLILHVDLRQNSDCEVTVLQVESTIPFHCNQIAMFNKVMIITYHFVVWAIFAVNANVLSDLCPQALGMIFSMVLCCAIRNNREVI